MENQENKTETIEKNDYYKKFSENLKNKRSVSLQNKLYSLIEGVKKDVFSTEETPDKVKEFLNDFESEFQTLWNEKDPELAGEAIERKISLILYDKFMAIYPIERDKNMSDLFEIYKFIQPCHLEISESLLKEGALEYANHHINKIVTYKTPRDKLVSIINCCKFISSMVSHGEDNEERPTGADDFLPCLIYAILKAKPRNSYADINFIRDFRCPDRLRGLEEYYYTAYESAIQFIEDLDVTKLKIDPEEFETLVSENRKTLGLAPQSLICTTNSAEELGKSERATVTGFDSKDETKRFNVELAEKDTSEETLRDVTRKLGQIKELTSFDAKKQKFYTVEPGKILVKEVDELLEDYKRICNQHYELSKKVEEINKVIEEKSEKAGKKNGRRLWGLFKFA